MQYHFPPSSLSRSLRARWPRRQPAPASHAHSGQPTVTKARSNGRLKRTRAHLRAMEPTTTPAGDRPGTRGSAFRLDLPPPLLKSDLSS